MIWEGCWLIQFIYIHRKFTSQVQLSSTRSMIIENTNKMPRPLFNVSRERGQVHMIRESLMNKAWVHQVRVVVSVPDLDCLCFWGNDTGRNRSSGTIIAPVPRHAEDGCEQSRIASNRLLWGKD